MKKVERITSTLNRLLADDVDTDQIIPARYLKTTGRGGLGAHLFADWRERQFDAGNNSARVLLAGANFGCGSSREHAVWALADFGFAAVIARSFADIFRANALKNGLVPVEVDAPVHARLANDRWLSVTIDVGAATLSFASGDTRETVPFPLDAFARRCLGGGVDELEYLLGHAAAIDAYEARRG